MKIAHIICMLWQKKTGHMAYTQLQRIAEENKPITISAQDNRLIIRK